MAFSTNQPSDYFAIGFQSAKGTEATSYHFTRHQDGTAIDLTEDVQSEREGGGGQEVGFRYKSMLKADGQVNENARAEAAMVGFLGALGKTAFTFQPGTMGIATGFMGKRITTNPTLPYLTAEQRFADQIERVSDAKVTSLELSGEAGRPLKLSYSILGGGTPYNRAIGSALTPNRETNDPVFFPQGSYAIDGAGTTKITKFSAKISRSLDDSIQTTTLFREDLVELNADYDLDFTLKYEDPTLYKKIKFAGGTVVPIALATGSFGIFSTNTVASGAAGWAALDVDFPLIQYVGAKVNKLDPDGKTVYLDVSAMTIAGPTNSVVVDVLGIPSQALPAGL